MNAQQRAIVAFCESFGRDPLYRTGFSDAFQYGGALRPETVADLLAALSYVTGYADACRMACPYQGAAWRIAHLVGIIARTLRLVADGEDPPWSTERLESTLHAYRHELAELCDRKDAAG